MAMDCQHDEIVRALLDSYQEVGGINRIDCQNLPSKVQIEALCEDLLHLLFPGFLDEEAIHGDDIALITSDRVAGFTEKLGLEIARALRYRGTPEGEVTGVARTMCCDFVRGLSEVRRLLSTDVQAAYDGDPAARNIEEIILSYPCIEAIAIQRSAHALYNAELPLVPRIMTEWAHARTGIDIHPGAKIGPYFFIDHGTGVVVGETCTIGERVKLYHGVTLGARSFEKDDEGNPVKGIKRHPDVEDHVVIYPNATVLGGDTVIGEHSTIGGNVFITESIPAHSLVAYKDGENRVLDKRNKPAA